MESENGPLRRTALCIVPTKTHRLGNIPRRGGGAPNPYLLTNPMLRVFIFLLFPFTLKSHDQTVSRPLHSEVVGDGVMGVGRRQWGGSPPL